MKVFIDTEFYEFQTIDNIDQEIIPGSNSVQLISLGAVREDGAEFYAENSEFDFDSVPEDHWIQENVRPHLGGPHARRGTPEAIAWNFRRFVNNEFINRHDKPEFWGYFCDYDWVAICGLYGRMVDLPNEFPKFCLDLKQEMHRMNVDRHDLPTQDGTAHHALADARWIRNAYNYMPGDGLGQDLV